MATWERCPRRMADGTLGARCLGCGLGRGRQMDPPGLASQSTGMHPTAPVPAAACVPARLSPCHLLHTWKQTSGIADKAHRTGCHCFSAPARDEEARMENSQERPRAGWSLWRRPLNKMGKRHMMWSTGSRGQQALALRHGRHAKGGFTFVNVWKKLKGE